MRKIRSTLIPTAAIAAICLGLVGCTAGPNANSGNDGGGTVLTMSGWADDTVADALIDQFEKDHPGVTINYTGLPWPNILSQTNTELVSGTASDIVVVFPGNGNPLAVQTLAKGSYLADLSSSPWVKNFNAANQALMGADGKVTMASNNVAMIPAIYNSQGLKAVAASAPNTWSDVLKLCTTAAQHGKVAYALAGVADGNYHTIPFALTASLLYGPDPEFVKKQYSGDANFENSAWTKALDKYREMVNAGCFTADATGTSLDIAQGQVARGDALGMITVSPQIETIEGMAPAGTTFETAAFPATDNPAETFLPVGLGAGYGINAKSKHMDLAKEFIDFYMSDAGLKIAVAGPALYPSKPVDGFTPPAALSGVAKQASSDMTVPIADQTWPNAIVNDSYTTGLQAFIGGSTSAADLLKQMDNAWKQ